MSASLSVTLAQAAALSFWIDLSEEPTLEKCIIGVEKIRAEYLVNCRDCPLYFALAEVEHKMKRVQESQVSAPATDHGEKIYDCFCDIFNIGGTLNRYSLLMSRVDNIYCALWRLYVKSYNRSSL
jgi:hypothetical protein